MDSDEEDFVKYGSPLDPIDEESLPRKKTITVEDQYATDEHGRRRFHGAFTGGFSAGFCNSAGSLEGWQPSNFISSRNNRTEIKDQSVFDYMDDEDKGEHGICPMSLKVKPHYDDKSSNNSSKKRIREITAAGPLSGVPVVQQLFAPVRDTIGVKLLMKMGWKPGQGIGPRLTKAEKRLRRKTEQNMYKGYGCQLPTYMVKSEVEEESDESDFDINLEEITFAPDDYKSYITEPKQNAFGLGYKSMDRRNVLSSNRPELSKLTVNGKTIRGQAFGVSVFEDDDDDIYNTDDMSNYDFSLGPSNEQKNIRKEYSTANECIEGFHVSTKVSNTREKFPLPVIPNDFIPLKSRKFRWESDSKSERGKKITTVGERMKIIDDGTDSFLSPDKNESFVKEDKKIQSTIAKESEIGSHKFDSSFKPFVSDKEKQQRYEKFLLFRKLGVKGSIFPITMTEWEMEREKSEFEQAARLYRPLSDDMANRFTVGAQEDVHDILKPVEKTINVKEQALNEAVFKKLYGPLTRKKFTWIPDRIVCKRFNVPEPVSSGTLLASAETTKFKNHKTSIFDVLKSDIRVDAIKKDWDSNQKECDSSMPQTESMQVVSENEKSEEHEMDENITGITKKIDLFKAIFLSSSEDEAEREDSAPVEVTNILKDEVENEIQRKIEDKIKYSPPRGIFMNLDLDALRYQPNTSKSSEIIKEKEAISTILDISSNVADIGPEIYGPKLPNNLTCAGTERPCHIFKSKSKDVNDIWVEKNRKHKKHKEHKKHRKHKKHKYN